jgi:hypothetical protein
VVGGPKKQKRRCRTISDQAAVGAPAAGRVTNHAPRLKRCAPGINIESEKQ